MVHLVDSSLFRRILVEVSAGTTTQTTAAVDTRGYQGVRLALLVGTIGATATVKVQLESSADNTTWTTAAESIDFGADDDNKLAFIDLMPPPARYVRLKITRGSSEDALVTIAGSTTTTLNLEDADLSDWTAGETIRVGQVERVISSVDDDENTVTVTVALPAAPAAGTEVLPPTANSAVLGGFADLYRGVEQPAAADATEMGRLKYIGTDKV